MEMTEEEINDFLSSCIYHQMAFILSNILTKCIDFLLNQHLVISRIAKFIEIKQKKPQYYEGPSIFALYELGVVYLAKFISNHSVDYYDDQVHTISTNVDQMIEKLKRNSSDNNWYTGKPKIIKEEQQTNHKVSLINQANLEKDFDINNLCEPLLEFIYNAKSKDPFDLNFDDILYKFVDHYYHRNMEKKYHHCKKCLNTNKNKQYSKEEFIEVLKLLKYFFNTDEYTPDKCYLYKYYNKINDYLYFDSTNPTYAYFLNELIKIERYFKNTDEYIENFKYLIKKARYSTKYGLNSFEMNSYIKNIFF